MDRILSLVLLLNKGLLKVIWVENFNKLSFERLSMSNAPLEICIARKLLRRLDGEDSTFPPHLKNF